MIITYFGKQFFKIQKGEIVLSFNPVSKSSKSGINAHFGADVALVTTNHPDYNGIEQLTHGERVPFAITGPGDYEIKEIFINLCTCVISYALCLLNYIKKYTSNYPHHLTISLMSQCSLLIKYYAS